jgi:hypothetical protein
LVVWFLKKSRVVHDIRCDINMGVLEGLKLSWNRHYRKIELFIDSKVVVNTLRNNKIRSVS